MMTLGVTDLPSHQARHKLVADKTNFKYDFFICIYTIRKGFVYGILGMSFTWLTLIHRIRALGLHKRKQR